MAARMHVPTRPRLKRQEIRSLNEGDKIGFMLEDDRRGRGKQAEQIEKV
jgi:cold shock CspA family protein